VEAPTAAPRDSAAPAPAVSFVVAAYNHQAYIERLLNSILRQTFADFELIVIDDGSTDSTADVAERTLAGDARARLIRQENRGVIEARNRGVRLARGEFVTIVDSDDLLPDDRAERQVEALRRRPGAALVYGDAWIIDESDRPIARFQEIYPPRAGDFSVELLAAYCFTPAISVMFRRSAWERSGPFWGPPANTDHLKWIELGLFGEAILMPDPPLGCWRRHGGNVSRPDPRGRLELYRQLREGLRELVRRHPELGARVGERRLKRRYGRCSFMGGFYAGLAGEWRLAREAFAEAWGVDRSPVNAAAWASTLPVARAVAAPFYRLTARRKLKVV
jgi:glycosyltransferase involved in cell wall biosynthesis